LEVVDAFPNAPLGWECLPTFRELDVLQGTSQIRKIIHDAVINNGFSRPPANVVLHQRREATEIGLIKTITGQQKVEIDLLT
jgi:hypothetical protein